MTALRILQRSSRSYARFSTSTHLRAEETSSSKNPFAHLNSRANDTAPLHRQFMKNKPLGPHLTNTTSTIANAFPSLGEDKPPADQITSVDPDFMPKDSIPKNTETMTGGTQGGGPKKGPNAELDVGEIDGGIFKVEPHRRTGEKDRDMRARLLYQSRKRGTLESDLLLSTFAAKNLPTMSSHQLQQYDLFLDENDWDIYYWATQEPESSQEAKNRGMAVGGTNADAMADKAIGGGVARVAGGGKDAGDTANAPDSAPKQPSTEQANARAETVGQVRPPAKGEWAATIGTFKPAYRPVPHRWRSSEILSMLRKHVIDNSAGGVQEALSKVDGEGLSQSVQGTGGSGLGFMPKLEPMT